MHSILVKLRATLVLPGYSGDPFYIMRWFLGTESYCERSSAEYICTGWFFYAVKLPGRQRSVLAAVAPTRLHPWTIFLAVLVHELRLEQFSPDGRKRCRKSEMAPCGHFRMKAKCLCVWFQFLATGLLFLVVRSL